MDASLISAVSALGGATIGGAISFIGSWLVEQRQSRAQWFTQDRLRRQDLYREFLHEASKCYVDALLHDNPDIASLVALYGLTSRMHVMSSPDVVAAAELVVRRIADTYAEPVVPMTNAITTRDAGRRIRRHSSRVQQVLPCGA
jgi:hypothetical protein